MSHNFNNKVVDVIAAALGELTGLFPIKQLKLTGLKNMSDWAGYLETK